MPEKKVNIDPNKLKRPQKEDEDDDNGDKSNESVTAGAVNKVIDLMFNPTREKIREVTIVDRVQGRLFPQLDMINYMRKYCVEIAYFRQDANQYKKAFKHIRPLPPEPLDEFVYRTAQWQKSVLGKNLERGTDIALAEVETKGMEDEDYGDKKDVWKE